MAVLSLEKRCVKIVSNGLNDFHVYDGEGNEILKGAVRNVVWKFGAHSTGRVYIELLPVAVEVEGELAGLEADMDQAEAEGTPEPGEPPARAFRRAMEQATRALEQFSNAMALHSWKR
jgi:hypothetical protein